MSELSFEQFGRKLNDAASALRNEEAAIVFGGSADLAGEIKAAYRVAAGGDGKLSGTSGARRRSGKEAAVTAKAKDVRRYGDGTYVGLVVPVGPYGLIERDIDPHVIAPFSYSLRTVRSRVRKAVRSAPAGQRATAARVALAGLDARTAKALYVPGLVPKNGKATGYMAVINHPGTKGREVFSRTVQVRGKDVARGMSVEMVQTVVDGYKGRKGGRRK